MCYGIFSTTVCLTRSVLALSKEKVQSASESSYPFSLLGVPSPTSQVLSGASLTQGFLSSLTSGTMSVSLVLLTLRHKPRTALVGFTEDHLCLLLSYRDVPHTSGIAWGALLTVDTESSEEHWFWGLSVLMRCLHTGQLAGTSACSQKRQDRTYRSCAHRLWWLGLEGNSGRWGRWAPFWKASGISESHFPEGRTSGVYSSFPQATK